MSDPNVKAALRFAEALTILEPNPWPAPLTAEEEIAGWVTIRDANGAIVAGLSTETYWAIRERERKP